MKIIASQIKGLSTKVMVSRTHHEEQAKEKSFRTTPSSDLRRQLSTLRNDRSNEVLRADCDVCAPSSRRPLLLRKIKAGSKQGEG